MSHTPSRQDYDHYMTPNYSPQQVIPVRGEGSRLWDQQGREYIDFAGVLLLTPWVTVIRCS
ncbi:hypothetical protein HSBAA_46880 [Vreelandella sulfidaeris]|uniref:Uncharacterized protein n=1 Tax=Vreelandella sulfidaeris TaxID=115553 RepID=A0A455UB14_9GAMM|nr:hypothetical protein HSBAA_46880 [Halomonas sulfidaeris]